MTNPAVAFHLALARMQAIAELAREAREHECWDMLATPESEQQIRDEWLAEHGAARELDALDQPAPL